MAVFSSKIRLAFNNVTKNYNTHFLIIRYGSYKSSEFLEDIGNFDKKIEITKNVRDWKNVEKILPPTIIPQPIKKEDYPSGWRPQLDNLTNHQYFVERTKNHMIPVYLELSNNNIRRHTVIKKIQGDIWLLENELTEFIKTLTIKPIRLQVHEFAGKITLNGDFVNAIKYWLQKKGF